MIGKKNIDQIVESIKNGHKVEETDIQKLCQKAKEILSE